jgi:hypothetical protein
MSPRNPKLSDLFGELSSHWPIDHVREFSGTGGSGDPQAWLSRLDTAVKVANVRTGGSADSVAVQAELSVDPLGGFAADPDGWPFVIVSMPDVEFRIQPLGTNQGHARLFASRQDSGFSLVIEGLPVEIRLPAGLITPHPDTQGAPDGSLVEETGDFVPGRHDDLKTVLRRGGPTSVYVHIRIVMTNAYEFDIQPAVPISFGRCGVSGIPCLAAHDFRLIPSPELAPNYLEWLRHPVDPRPSSLTGPYDGMFSVRALDIDEDSEAARTLMQWLDGHAEGWTSTSEVVLEDLVVPFFSPYVIPVPVHATVGVRRKVVDVTDRTDVYEFEQDPVHIVLRRDHLAAIDVASLFYRSMPREELDERFLPTKPEFPTANGWDDPGLTFDAALVFGDERTPQTSQAGGHQQAIRFGIEEHLTFFVGYRREWGTDGHPTDGDGLFERAVNAVLHWEVAGLLSIDIMGVKLGASPAMLYGENKSWSDSSLITGDFYVSMPPTGSDTSAIRLRGLNGEKVAFPVEGIGWRFGALHLEGLALPDGVVLYVYKYGLILSELGVRAEDGATYLTFSGGLAIDPPKGIKLAVTVKGLRFRVAGDSALPAVKVDGFFLRAANDDESFLLEGGGYYREADESAVHVTEWAFALAAQLKFGAKKYRFGVDGLFGTRTGSDESFRYFMVEAYYKGAVGPIAQWEFTGARALYARNMIPKLRDVDREARELRYFKWYKDTNPLAIQADRRLSSWQASQDSWALGIGASASMAGLGKVVELTAFVLILRGPAEQGVLVVAEVFALASARPFGYAVVEVDSHNDRVSVLVGVDVRVGTFVKDAPAWMNDVGAVTGTLFISNDPCTFAIGRLADSATWLGLRFDVDLWLEASLVIAFCVEHVEGGPNGFGLTARIEGGIGKRGVVRLSYDAGFTLLMTTFSTGSTDYALVLEIAAGIRFELFGFLRIGVSTRMAFRIVGGHPARAELTAEIRLETPWFLPDVTWRMDAVYGELRPEKLSTVVQPLRSAAAKELTGIQLGVHLERFDPAWSGEGVAPIHSVAELSAPPRPEAERLTAFENDTAARPVATDATIAVNWSVAVNDRIGVGAGVADDRGNQEAGDLTLTYELVGLAVRRRPRFGNPRDWNPLESKVELGMTFGGSAGPQLDGTFAPQILNKSWDVDVVIDGEPAPKRLLLNSVAPYDFTFSNPQGDDQLIQQHPGWPCCDHADDKDLAGLFHRVHWHDTRLGEPLESPVVSRFSDSNSTLRFLRPAWTRQAAFGGLADPTTVAVAELGQPGVVARADFDEAAVLCSVRIGAPRATRVTVVLFDRIGKEVGRQELAVTAGTFQTAVVPSDGPVTRLEIRAHHAVAAMLPRAAASALGDVMIEVDEVAYVGLRDYLDILVAEAACAGGPMGGGSGKLAFLPNHEYEISLTTRVTVVHPSAPAATADVEEFVYFRTKGLPGLNAVNRVGEEIDPYVRAAYTGGRAGVVYREEPVTLAFSEGFHVAVPIAVRPPGASAEQTRLLRMQLLVSPDQANRATTTYTVTSQDWIVAHPGGGTPPRRGDHTWTSVVGGSRTVASAMRTADPFVQRFAAMTQRPAVTCGLPDPSQVTGTVLVTAPPDPATGLWEPGMTYTASVRAEDGPFVDRRPFEAGDETALTPGTLGSGSAVWTVDDGRLVRAGADWGLATFGEATWEHAAVLVGIEPGAEAAGIGVGIGGGGGLFALVEEAANTRRLVIRRRAGSALVEVDGVDLPAGPEHAMIVLQVTAYDDLLRAAVGDTVVEADRDADRAGRLSLCSRGPATFASLQVTGVDMYQFRFTASRFTSFAEHIGSWAGRLDELGPDTLGVGTTTATVAQLWASSSEDVSTVMNPDAAQADRERVFATWTAGLGLAMKDDITALEVSCYVEQARTRALLIESPEPLDFTADTTVTLVGRQVRRPRPPRPRPAVPDGRTLADRLTTLARQPASPVPVRGGRPSVDEAIIDVEVDRDELRLHLHPALADAGELAVVLNGADGTLDLYRGIVRPPWLRGHPAILLAVGAGRIGHLPQGSDLTGELPTAQPGALFLMSSDLIDLIGRWDDLPVEVDLPVDVRVLQNGDARRALVIPVGGAAASALPSGPYRLTLSLARKRWGTTDPVDDVNSYERSVTLRFDIGA